MLIRFSLSFCLGELGFGDLRVDLALAKELNKQEQESSAPGSSGDGGDKLVVAVKLSDDDAKKAAGKA